MLWYSDRSGVLLPLDLARINTVAINGEFAKTPRYQGAGSSQVNPIRISNAHDELVKLGYKTSIRYAAGYRPDGTTTDDLIDEAVQEAKSSDVAILFIGSKRGWAVKRGALPLRTY
jgi:beta-glucosidase